MQTELTKMIKLMVERSHLDKSWPISHMITSPPAPWSVSQSAAESPMVSPAPATVCPQLRALVSTEPLIPRHTLCSNSRKPRVSQITVWCQQVLAFYTISSKFVDAGLNFSHFNTILSSLLCSLLMGLIKTGGILEWKLLFQYILFATSKYRNVLLSLYQLYEPLEIRAIMR